MDASLLRGRGIWRTKPRQSCLLFACNGHQPGTALPHRPGPVAHREHRSRAAAESETVGTGATQHLHAQIPPAPLCNHCPFCTWVLTSSLLPLHFVQFSLKNTWSYQIRIITKKIWRHFTGKGKLMHYSSTERRRETELSSHHRNETSSGHAARARGRDGEDPADRDRR